tara:strand:+ start:1051 stop:1164 length:114 start_codon:yes stop_codon:yes gene_type:complete
MSVSDLHDEIIVWREHMAQERLDDELKKKQLEIGRGQ